MNFATAYKVPRGQKFFLECVKTVPEGHQKFLVKEGGPSHWFKLYYGDLKFPYNLGYKVHVKAKHASSNHLQPRVERKLG